MKISKVTDYAALRKETLRYIIYIFKGHQSQRLDLEPELERSDMLSMNSSMKIIAENWIMLGWNSHKYWLSYLALMPKGR